MFPLLLIQGLHSSPSIVIICIVSCVCSSLSLEQAQKQACSGRRLHMGNGDGSWLEALKASAGDLPPKCAQLQPQLKILSEWLGSQVHVTVTI